MKFKINKIKKTNYSFAIEKTDFSATIIVAGINNTIREFSIPTNLPPILTSPKPSSPRVAIISAPA
jgi:hypothetical protein